MDYTQFVAISDLLFFSPYIVPLIAACTTKAQKSQGATHRHQPKSNIGLFWAIQVVVCLALGGATLYLVGIGTSNGLIDINIFRRGMSWIALMTWEGTKNGSPVFGGIFGAFMVYRGFKFRKEKKALLISLGVFCLIYGCMQPYLMQLYLANILDSHLIG